jgi:hypothetical protein
MLRFPRGNWRLASGSSANTVDGRTNVSGPGMADPDMGSESSGRRRRITNCAHGVALTAIGDAAPAPFWN